MFELVNGTHPFAKKNQQDTFKAIIHERVKFQQGISILLRDIISKCLNKNLQKRPSVKELLQNEYFQSMQESDSK